MVKTVFYILIWGLFLIGNTCAKSREISPQFQARLVKVYLSSMKIDLDRFTLAIISKDIQKSLRLKNALTKKSHFKINNKAIDFSIVLLDEVSPDKQIDAYFFYDNYQKVQDKLSFVQSSKLVGDGATIGFELKKTVPKIYINIKSLKSLGIIYPLDLLRFATIMGDK
ncbi:MAG: hypothetical protein KC646_13215 [Candidatus Cloacimonetes bacterium]|nr:hypothetical protein [Candidatus Cloacimonadota bacterium]